MGQEGRSIGLVNKLHAYNLQDQGRDTAQANVDLGFNPDAREYTDAIGILKYFQLHKLRLLTNNPHKCGSLQAAGFEVERVPLNVGHQSENEAYLNTKRDVFGHWINHNL